MTPSRFRLIDEVFQSAADLQDGDRSAYLDNACAGDGDLRAEVESLLAVEAGGGMAKMEAAVARAAIDMTGAPRSELGRHIGPYRVLSELGKGGMGTVYKAVRDDDTFKKEVAIKVVRGGVASEFLLQRFRHERRLLATLDHPNIARVLDGGETDDGMPYLVMEYVKGVPVHQYARENSLDIPATLRLFRDVCAAVENAHRNLIIHRDLKPGNILVTGDGAPKLLDFGIAKLLDPPGGRSRSPDLSRSPESRSPETRTMFRMLTPDYSSPEQIRGEAVTTATDVYSLGAVLYELLTGDPPNSFSGASPGELERLVAETAIRPPSAAAPQRGIASDLDTVVLMALRKEPERRYPRVEDLSEDLRRFLEGLPVSAREDTIAYRTSKFLRRYKAPVAAASLVALSLLGGIVIAARQARKAERRFEQVRGFARTVLFDIHRELENVPGAARAREALVHNVENYLNQMVATDSSDDAALESEFAAIYLRLGEMRTDSQKSLENYRRSKAILDRRGKLSRQDRRTYAAVQERIGDADVALGRSEDAYAAYDLAIAAAAESLRADPKDFEARLGLGNAEAKSGREYMRLYNFSKAEERLTKSIAAFEGLLVESAANKDALAGLTTAQQGLASLYTRKNRLTQALELRERVFEHRLRLANDDPQDLAKKRELMRAHMSLGHLVGGVTSIHMGNPRAAIVHYRTALAIAESLVEIDPQSPEALTDLALMEYCLGGTLDTAGEGGESIAVLRRSVDTYKRLLAKDPKNTTHMIYQAGAEASLGGRLYASGRIKEAIATLESGRAKLMHVMANNPEDRTTKIDMLALERTLALVYAAQGDRRQALALAQKSIGFARMNAAEQTDPFSLHMDLPTTYEVLADVHLKLGEPAEARRWLQQAAAEWELLRKDGPLPPNLEKVARRVQGRLKKP